MNIEKITDIIYYGKLQIEKAEKSISENDFDKAETYLKVGASLFETASKLIDPD